MRPTLRILFLLAVLFLGACGRFGWALDLPDGSLIDDSEEAGLAAERQTAHQLLIARDFDGLEQMAVKLRAERTVLGSGMPSIGTFYEGVADKPESEQVLDQSSREALAAWRKSRPDSVAAKLAEARVLEKEAWQARGSGYANTVTAQGGDTFEQKLHEEAAVLASIKEQRNVDSDWYVSSNSVSQGLGEDSASLLERNREGAKQFPGNVAICGGPVICLLPRWGGTNKQVLDYITEASDTLGGDDGDVLYARLAKKVLTYSFDINPYKDIGMSWPRVRHGMEVIAWRYPHSKYMANMFCFMASIAQDHDTAHAAFARLGAANYLAVAWDSQANFKSAFDWAQQ